MHIEKYCRKYLIYRWQSVRTGRLTSVRGGCFTKAKTQNLSESLNMTQVGSGRAPDCDERLGQLY